MYEVWQADGLWWWGFKTDFGSIRSGHAETEQEARAKSENEWRIAKEVEESGAGWKIAKTGWDMFTKDAMISFIPKKEM